MKWNVLETWFKEVHLYNTFNDVLKSYPIAEHIVTVCMLQKKYSQDK